MSTSVTFGTEVTNEEARADARVLVTFISRILIICEVFHFLKKVRLYAPALVPAVDGEFLLLPAGERKQD